MLDLMKFQRHILEEAGQFLSAHKQGLMSPEVTLDRLLDLKIQEAIHNQSYADLKKGSGKAGPSIKSSDENFCPAPVLIR